MLYDKIAPSASSPGASEALFGSLRVLPDADVTRIAEAALDVLDHVGVHFDDPDAVDLLIRAGAKADGPIVRIPRAMTIDCLRADRTPVCLGARLEDASIHLGERRFVTTNGFGTVAVLDPKSAATRASTLDDLVRLTQLADRMDEVGFCQHQTTPQDVPTDQLDVIQAAALLLNTSKHAHLSTYSAEHLDAIRELGTIAGDNAPHPIYSLGCCSISPLRFPREGTQTLLHSAKHRIPFLIVSGSVAGITSPTTLAGTLITQTAELLAALILGQKANPDAPMAWGSFSSPMDPKTATQRLAAAELSLLNGATAQLCEHFGVPFGYGTGGVSDARSGDVQAGIERAMTTFSAALCGVEVIHDAVSGILESGRTVSLELMIVDAALCRLVRRFLQGVRVTEETLATAVIEEVGPGGSYAAAMHTARHFRDEILIENMADLLRSDTMVPSLSGVSSRVDEILATPAPGPGILREQEDAMIDVCVKSGVDETLIRRALTRNRRHTSPDQGGA